MTQTMILTLQNYGFWKGGNRGSLFLSRCGKRLSKAMANPTTTHWLAIKRILRYLNRHHAHMIEEASTATVSSLDRIWYPGHLQSRKLSPRVMLSLSTVALLLLLHKLFGFNLC
ncbi:hypothetical protein CK203_062133 [Vitis vinifera]|uniref:Retrovirus-related Pol polyprotein from transposon RE1 n=1 Tax=Vitis vinifera TaxID=29760 RepID=A0A438FR10_VITVI|nr:hypothetical protein CK203_062133 [Vitis vinifera]